MTGRPSPRVLAHRGDTTAAATENTIAAFLAAAAAGASGVELDVRRTADGALVVVHDAVFEGVGPVADARLRDLPADVAVLDEALGVLEGLVVNVEIKNDPREPGYDAGGSLAHAVVAVVLEHEGADRAVVSSFDLPTIDAVRQASATLQTGWLLGRAAHPLDAVPVAAARAVSALHLFVGTVGPDVVAAAHGAGLDVAVWTVNSRHDLERVVAAGVDAVITDDVALALEVLAADEPARNGVAGPASA